MRAHLSHPLKSCPSPLLSEKRGALAFECFLQEKLERNEIDKEITFRVALFLARDVYCPFTA